MSLRQTLHEPIFVIGAARSGTTVVADILSGHSNVAYWVEPKYIWRFGDASAKSDLRGAKAATPIVRKYIRQKFWSFLKKSQKTRFLEKTPSNCFRLEFIYEIFPQGKFVIINRDGRNVAASALNKWTSKPSSTALKRRVLANEIPLRDIPFYAKDFIRDVIARTLNSKAGYIWGPRFSGIEDVRATHTLEEVCAIQWRESVRAVKRSIKKLPDNSHISIRYEDLLEDPNKIVKRVLHFCNLEAEVGVLQDAEGRIADYLKSNKSRNDNTDNIDRIQNLISDDLRDMGYI